MVQRDHDGPRSELYNPPMVGYTAKLNVGCYDAQALPYCSSVRETKHGDHQWGIVDGKIVRGESQDLYRVHRAIRNVRALVL